MARTMFSHAKLNGDRFLHSYLPEITHEQEEPDSAFEATQYFFEDITPETSIGKDLRSILHPFHMHSVQVQ